MRVVLALAIRVVLGIPVKVVLGAGSGREALPPGVSRETLEVLRKELALGKNFCRKVLALVVLAPLASVPTEVPPPPRSCCLPSSGWSCIRRSFN